MADSMGKLERAALADVSYSDDEVALVAAASAPAVDYDDDDDDEEDDEDVARVAEPAPAFASHVKSEAQVHGVMVLSLLDKIIGVVDQIQQTQGGLEARQEAMEKAVSGIQGELSKLAKSHSGTAHSVDKMLEKVRKVSVNVKSVRSNLERQAGQIKKLESNENELLKRRHFKILLYQDETKTPKPTKTKSPEAVCEAGVAADGLGQIPGGGPDHVNSDEEVEIEEIIEESRAERIKRSGKQRVDNLKKAFSKEEMEKTKLKTKENLAKTKQRTRENLEKTKLRTRKNLEKTKHSLEKKMGKLSARLSPNLERKEKIKVAKEKAKRSRPKTYVYRVPPFTFHVKKVRDGEVEEEVVVVQKDGEEEEEVESEDGLGGVERGGVGVEEGELVRVDSPERDALLQVTEDSQLAVAEGNHLKKVRGD